MRLGFSLVQWCVSVDLVQQDIKSSWSWPKCFIIYSHKNTFALALHCVKQFNPMEILVHLLACGAAASELNWAFTLPPKEPDCSSRQTNYGLIKANWTRLVWKRLKTRETTNKVNKIPPRTIRSNRVLYSASFICQGEKMGFHFSIDTKNSTFSRLDMNGWAILE